MVNEPLISDTSLNAWCIVVSMYDGGPAEFVKYLDRFAGTMALTFKAVGGPHLARGAPSGLGVLLG